MAARTDVELDFGGATRREIQAALAEAGVLTNEFADHLLALNVFDDVPTGYVDIAFVTAATVHPQGPAFFTTLMRAARAAGFEQPPIECAPWLRLAVDQDRRWCGLRDARGDGVPFGLLEFDHREDVV